jgi:hypothetical protein
MSNNTIKTLNQSRLLADQDIPFRLARTNLGSYFIFNMYIQLIFLLAATIINVGLQCLYECETIGPRLSSLGWSLQDFSFEFIIMNLCLSTSIVIESY